MSFARFSPLHRALRLGGVVLALALAPVSAAAAVAQQAPTLSSADQQRIEEIMANLGRGRFIGQVAISPDGKRLAWVEAGPQGGREIRVAPLANLDAANPGSALGDGAPVTAATAPGQACDEGMMAWSPDSSELAFFSDCAAPGDQSDLYVTRLGPSPKTRRLTVLHGDVDAPAFSPDGRKIAFLYVKGATRAAGALAAQNLPSGVIGEDHIDVERVAMVDADAAAAAEPAFATPANLYAYEFDWSPDSKSLAYVAADPPGENNWWVAKLYTQELGGAPQAILAPTEVAGSLRGMQIAVPRWSPDGKAIAFIGGLMSDQGVTGGDVWVISSAGGTPRDLMPGWPVTAGWIAWEGDRHLFVNEQAGGDTRLVKLALDADGPDATRATAGKPIFSVPGSVDDGRLEHSLSSTADRSLFVMTASTFDDAPEIYAARPHGPEPLGRFAGLKQLTHVNDGLKPAGGKTVSLEWTDDGFHLQGWLMLPENFDRAKKYPLLVEVHGGPAAAAVPHWGSGGALSPEAFSALGYFVLLPNPRGSYGEGEKFTQANRKDFGYGDLRDILAGVDTVLKKYPVDARRVGLTGWSYGGFMSMFAVTQTQRFRAAVAGAGISDWLSYYGENSIDQWMIPYFGASVYDDPQVYAKSSAIDFIKHVHTPTLIVVGDRDGECPAPQSFEFWHALRDQHVPTELVVYPNEGHGFVNPEHRRDVLERALEWFAEYMPAGS